MIFYGTNSSKIKTGQLRNVKCPNCDNDATMTYSVFGKYFYIYWIPFFPIGKVNIVECNTCKATYDIKNLDQKIKAKFKIEQDRNPIKTPLKHFSGIGIVAAIIIGGIFYDKMEEDKTLDYAKKPKIGDVYYFELPELRGHYSTLKITKITKDSVFVVENNMEIDSKSEIDQILKEKNYTYPFSYSKEELKNLTQDLSVFYKITRD
ncbi:zinc-ribbon domain-containing protein [Flavobacterium jejuense]|uniref:Zinc-ribbon domain-containing protein n=1 Tax=Flavobacterium jejuense TaxID=1544455 RepID=A0ABX0IKG8_9FLAO|nr:zinc-ribbon domain-containing protein [Flavobacterium jejuense]NHN24320.1 zinc-ribbon domain-containing protein [Flavobacterium jejuense]